LTLLLVSVAESGPPHVALLSVGEVVAMASDRLRLALWPRSAAAEHLARTGNALLYVIADGAGYAIDVQAAPLTVIREPGVHVSVFDARILDVHEDRVAYAELISGASFRLVDRERVIERWERTVEAMRSLPASPSIDTPATESPDS
jgi:hypothetical protein